MSVFTKAFWRATTERMLRGAGIGGLLYLGQQFGDVIAANWAFNAFDLTWSLPGFMLGGALVSLLFSLSGNAVSGNGPSFNRTEVIVSPPIGEGGVSSTPGGAKVYPDAGGEEMYRSRTT